MTNYKYIYDVNDFSWLYSLKFVYNVNDFSWWYILIISVLVCGILLVCFYLFIINKDRLSLLQGTATDSIGDIKIELIDPTGKLLKYKVSSQIMQKYGNIISVGRGERAFVKIANKSVSNLHCTLIVTNGELNIRDENSTNGTYVDGVKLTPNVPMIISKRNRVKIGELTGYIFLL